MELTSILIRTMVSQTPILDPEGSYLQTYKTGVKANSIFPASFLREIVITGAHEEMHIMATACGSPNAPTRNAIRIGCQTVLQSIEGFYKTESTNRKFSLYYYRHEDAVLNQAGERKTLLEQYHDQMGRVEVLLQSPSQAAAPSSQESVGSTQGSAAGEGTAGVNNNTEINGAVTSRQPLSLKLPTQIHNAGPTGSTAYHQGAQGQPQDQTIQWDSPETKRRRSEDGSQTQTGPRGGQLAMPLQYQILGTQPTWESLTHTLLGVLQPIRTIPAPQNNHSAHGSYAQAMMTLDWVEQAVRDLKGTEASA